MSAAVTQIVLAIIAVIAIILLLMTSRSAELIVSENMALSRKLSAEQTTLMEVHTDFLRLLTAQAAGSAPDIDKQVKAFKAKISQIGVHLQALKSSVSAESTPKIDKVVSGLEAYSGTIDVVASMLSLDFGSAAGMLKPFEDNYASLAATFTSLVDDESSSAEARARQTGSLVRWSVGVLVALSLAGVAVSWRFQSSNARAIADGISTIADATGRLAKEDLSVDPERLARSDELQSIVDGLIVFRDNIRRVQELLTAQRGAEEDRVRMLASLASDFDRSVQSDISRSTDSANALITNATELSARMAKTRDASTTSSAAADHVSANVQSVAAAIEEFSATTREIARQAEVASRRIVETVEATEAAHGRVRTLQEGADRIGMIVKLISDIASQTNLLALNATIEAARAGDAGKGFAVVAGEVKVLANQTAKATEEIRSQIEAIQTETGEVGEGMGNVTKLTAEVAGIVSVIVQGTDQQDSAIGEISASVNDASRGVAELREQVSFTRDETEGADRAAQDTMAKTQQLNEIIAVIDARSRDFTTALRKDADRKSH